MSNNQDLWAFLERREEEIVEQRKKLKDELEALRLARASIEQGQKETSKKSATERPPTIKDMIRSVLMKNVEGGTSDEIIRWINLVHGVEIARTSLSPQLSRLKAEGEVGLDEERGVWSLSLGMLKGASARHGDRITRGIVKRGTSIE